MYILRQIKSKFLDVSRVSKIPYILACYFLAPCVFQDWINNNKAYTSSKIQRDNSVSSCSEEPKGSHKKKLFFSFSF